MDEEVVEWSLVDRRRKLQSKKVTAVRKEKKCGILFERTEEEEKIKNVWRCVWCFLDMLLVYFLVYL